MHRPATGHVRAWVRLAALLALSAFVGAQSLVALHFALIPHSVCGGHEALVHVARPRPAATPPSPGATGGSVAAPASEPAPAERCALAFGASVHAAIPMAKPFATEVPAPKAEARLEWPVQPAVHSIALLALAPKQSPPAAHA